MKQVHCFPYRFRNTSHHVLKKDSETATGSVTQATNVFLIAAMCHGISLEFSMVTLPGDLKLPLLTNYFRLRNPILSCRGSHIRRHAWRSTVFALSPHALASPVPSGDGIAIAWAGVLYRYSCCPIRISVMPDFDSSFLRYSASAFHSLSFSMGGQ